MADMQQSRARLTVGLRFSTSRAQEAYPCRLYAVQSTQPRKHGESQRRSKQAPCGFILFTAVELTNFPLHGLCVSHSIRLDNGHCPQRLSMGTRAAACRSK